MTVEEFIQGVADVDARIKELEKEKEAVRRKYIDDNEPYPVGTKIKFTRTNGKECTGVVARFDSNYKGKIYVSAFPFKLDGEISQKKVRSNWIIQESIEVIE